MTDSGRDWRFDLIVFAAAGVAITLLFAITSLDIDAARIFYRAGARDRWPMGQQMPSTLLYRLAPLITASLVLGGLAVLAAGLLRRREAWLRQASFVLLSVVLGPGLLVNGLFKDHWERPRPRDVVEFGGQLHYSPPPLRGEGGKSFPCGHCSVAFLYAVGWWIWRRRRPYWAVASLATGLFAGAVLGVGRMAAGGHFLSDVVWSAFLALGLAHALYYYVVNVPAVDPRRDASADARASSPRIRYALSILAALGGAAVLVAVFVTPHGTQISTEIPLAAAARAPRIFELIARTANVDITIVDAPADQVSVAGELHGFGLPGSRLLARSEFEAEPIPTLRYRIEQHGWFTDLDGSVSIRLPAGRMERIVVQIERGNIEVTDATRSHVVKSGKLQLDLRTKSGRVKGWSNG
ncbi:MAG TPA: phosphatase PAP2 family protein [Burkholderiales bacterium]